MKSQKCEDLTFLTFLNRIISHFLPNNALKIVEPIFLSIPAFVVGIPVELVNSRFAWVIPKALFQEKLSPGIPVFVFFAINSFFIELVNFCISS